MDPKTLLMVMDFFRARLLGTLEAVEKKARELNVHMPAILSWRPGPGRAHIAWQAIHCAATHDKYLNVNILGKSAPADADLVKNFGGGSIPSDEGVPDLAEIRAALDRTYAPLKAFVASVTPEEFSRTIGPIGGLQRSVAEAIALLAWHEAHHHGQIHLTLNLFKASRG